VVAESLLVKQQLLILNRSRKRAPKLHPSDRIVAGVCALLMRPGRLIRSAIVLKPSTLLRLYRALRKRQYRWLFSSTVRKKPGPRGPSQDVVAAVVDMKQRNPDMGLPADRTADRPGLWHSDEQGCGATHSRHPVPAEARRVGAILAHSPRAREGQAYAGTEPGSERRTGECPVISLAAALSRALSDADGGVRCARRGCRTTPKVATCID
jgi:hypothetical protein